MSKSSLSQDDVDVDAWYFVPQPSNRELAIEKDVYMYRAYTAQVSSRKFDSIHHTSWV